MSSEWYVLRQDKKSGPYSSTILKQMASSGQLVPDDHIWKQGLTGWIPASRFAGLFAAVAASQGEVAAEPRAEAIPVVQSSVNETRKPLAKYPFHRGGLVLAAGALAVACVGFIVFAVRSAHSDKALVETASKADPSDPDPGNWSLKQYPQTTALLRRSAELGADIGVKNREDPSQLEEVVQRALLLQEVATLQAEIGDISGVESTLRLLRELNPIADGDAPLSLVFAQATAGVDFEADSVMEVVTQAGYSFVADHWNALLLQKLCAIYFSQGKVLKARQMLESLMDYSNSLNDPLQKIDALGQLGLAQVGLTLSQDVSKTVQKLAAMTNAHEDALGSVRMAIARIAEAWASAGEFQKAEVLLDLLGPTLLADNVRQVVVERQAAAFDFRGASKAAKKIDDVVFRARAQIEIQKRRLECCPVFLKDALDEADELRETTSQTLTALSLPSTSSLYSMVLIDAASTATRWRLAILEDLPNSVRHAVDKQIADANIFVSGSLSDKISIAPQDRARIWLAVAVTAARCNTPSSAAAFEKCLEQVGLCTEFSERRRLLHEMAFACDQVGRAESVQSWARSKSTYDQAALHLGLGRSQRQNEDVNIVARRGMIELLGGMVPRANSHAASSEMWKMLLSKLPPNCLKDNGYIIGRESFRFLAVPVNDGFAIAFPPEHSGINSWLHVLPHAGFAGGDASLTAAALNLPLGEVRQIGRFRVTKALARSPLDWVVISVQENTY